MNITSTSATGSAYATGVSSQAQQTSADFQAIASTLQSGNITQAQQAFAQLQKDNPKLAQAMNSAPSSSDSPALTDLKTLASALKSGDLSGAQQAFTQLQQDVQATTGKHHHHHHSADASAAASTDGGTDSPSTDASPTAGSTFSAIA